MFAFRDTTGTQNGSELACLRVISQSKILDNSVSPNGVGSQSPWTSRREQTPSSEFLRIALVEVAVAGCILGNGGGGAEVATSAKYGTVCTC